MRDKLLLILLAASVAGWCWSLCAIVDNLDALGQVQRAPPAPDDEWQRRVITSLQQQLIEKDKGP